MSPWRAARLQCVQLNGEVNVLYRSKRRLLSGDWNKLKREKWPHNQLCCDCERCSKITLEYGPPPHVNPFNSTTLPHTKLQILVSFQKITTLNRYIDYGSMN